MNQNRMKFSTHMIEKIEYEKHQFLEQKRMDLLQKSIDEIKIYFQLIELDELYITGSILIQNKFNNISDIDIAVKGLSTNLYFKAISELEEKLSRKVEIIELENCSFAEKIRKTGLKLK